MESFYKSYRQNSWGWGRGITDDEVKLIKEQVDDFYFKGASLETAPLSLKVDVSASRSRYSPLNFLPYKKDNITYILIGAFVLRCKPI